MLARSILFLCSAGIATLAFTGGCSGGSTPSPGTTPSAAPGDESSDPTIPAGTPSGGAGCDDACGSDAVCENGACVPLPSTCPCPKESYCDLATNSCKVGCTEQDQCNAGRYCDEAARSCKSGCLEADAECGSGKICVDHACIAGCRKDADCGSSALICEDQACVPKCTTCPDDGNPCTTDKCVRAECVHQAVADGKACTADANECTVDACKSGTCQHSAPTALTICDKANTPNNGMFVPEARACAGASGTTCTPPKKYCAYHADNRWYVDQTGWVKECLCNGTDMVVMYTDNSFSTQGCTRCAKTTVPDSGNGTPIPFVGCW